MKTCQACNEVFSEMGEWQKLCKPCFAKSKRAEEALAQNMEIERARLLYLENERAKMLYEERARADKLENKKEKLTIQISALNWRIYALEGQLYMLKKNNENTVFTPDFIKKVRMLCHPDKHNGSELSHNVFKVLNGLSQRSG